MSGVILMGVTVDLIKQRQRMDIFDHYNSLNGDFKKTSSGVFYVKYNI